jgi:hypothetical protein
MAEAELTGPVEQHGEGGHVQTGRKEEKWEVVGTSSSTAKALRTRAPIHSRVQACINASPFASGERKRRNSTGYSCTVYLLAKMLLDANGLIPKKKLPIESI